MKKMVKKVIDYKAKLNQLTTDSKLQFSDFRSKQRLSKQAASRLFVYNVLLVLTNAYNHTEHTSSN